MLNSMPLILKGVCILITSSISLCIPQCLEQLVHVWRIWLEISNDPIHRKSIEVFNRVRTMKNGWHVSQPDPLDEPRMCSMTASYLQDAILDVCFQILTFSHKVNIPLSFKLQFVLKGLTGCKKWW